MRVLHTLYNNIRNIMRNIEHFQCTILAITTDTTTDVSLEDADYEADEGDDVDGEYEEDDSDGAEKSNVTKTKTSRMEVQLPHNPKSDVINSNKIDSSTQKSAAIVIRLPAVRSESVPDGFKGRTEDKRQKHNFTSPKNHLNKDETKVDVKPDSYVTVTKSVSGSLDNAKSTPNDDKKFESTYYTKSSTCGYFTFSCNIVYGSNGRSKICRPKAPGKC